MKNLINGAFALIYLLSIVLFFRSDFTQEYFVLIMSHFIFMYALLFRDYGVSKAELCRSFILYVVAVVVLAYLPISGLWTLIPFYIVGFVHIKKVSYKETIGYFEHDDNEITDKEKMKRLYALWVAISVLITIIAFLW